MILIVSAKQWKKSCKKLVMPRDYIVMDATEDDDARLNRFNNCITMDGLNPPSKLIKQIGGDEYDDFVDYDKIEKAEKSYFKGPQFQQGIMAAVSGMLHENANIFIIMRNKAFKVYGKRFKKEFEKAFPVDFEFVEVFDGEYKDIKNDLQDDLSKSEYRELDNALLAKEKEMKKLIAKINKKKGGRR